MLYTKYQIDCCDVKNVYREFKDSKVDIAELCLKTLLNCVNTIPVSTAECERGFSKLNVVCNAFRSRLTVKHLSSLMFLSLTGPELSNWQPLTYVKSWLLSNRRQATATQGPSKMGSVAPDTRYCSIWKFL